MTDEDTQPIPWSVWTLRDAEGEFLGRVQATDEEFAIAKWKRLYGEEPASASIEA